MGIYLPTVADPCWSDRRDVCGWAYDQWAERDPRRRRAQAPGRAAGLGLIVGESLFGVVFAGIVAASGSDAPLAIVGEGFENWAVALGIVLYVATVAALYRVIRRSGDDQRA